MKFAPLTEKSQGSTVVTYFAFLFVFHFGYHFFLDIITAAGYETPTLQLE